VPDVFAAAKWEFARAVDALATHIGDQEFVLGSQFTVADILVGNVLSWARNSNVAIEAELVNRYADRVLERPALARALEKEQAFGT
jgi:glutathione S-transferase